MRKLCLPFPLDAGHNLLDAATRGLAKGLWTRTCEEGGMQLMDPAESNQTDRVVGPSPIAAHFFIQFRGGYHRVIRSPQ